MSRIIVFISFLALAGSSNLWAQTDSILVDGTYRTYELHLPVGYNASQSYPVVFNLHGLFSDGAEQQLYTHLDSIADVEQFIAVHPDGVGNEWNITGDTAAPNDSLFISNLIDSLSSFYSVNPCRIYSMGFSDGGFMSYVLGCQLAHRLAAIAVVSGNMLSITASVCFPDLAIPVLHIHGTNDQIVSFNGIVGLIPTVTNTVVWWAMTNNCSTVPNQYTFPDIVTTDSSNVELFLYPAGPDSAEVVLLQVNNGGHTWPGSYISLPYGFTNQDFDASSSIWSFFSQQPLAGCVPSAIAEPDPNATKVFPNPSNGIFVVTSQEHIEVIEVFDVYGRSVFRNELVNDTSVEVDLGMSVSGYYLIRTFDGERYQYAKVQLSEK